MKPGKGSPVAGALDAATEKSGKTAKPKGKSQVHRMEIRRAHGGYIVRHSEHRHPSGEPDHDRNQAEGETEHILPDAAALQQHVAENMGDGAAPAEGEAPGGGEAA